MTATRSMLQLSLLFVLLYAVYGQDPTVKIVETTPTAIDSVLIIKRDRDVTISCAVDNLQLGLQVKMQKDYIGRNGTRQTDAIATDTALVDNTKYSIERPSPFVWRLRIKRVQTSDEGNYTCYIQLTLQNWVFANVTVLVYVPPYFIPGSTSYDMLLTAGDNVELKCNATGRPTPVIEWSRTGNALLPIGRERHRGMKLTIPNIKAEDRGIYRCRVSNEVGTIIRNIKVDVKFAPMIQAPEVVLQAVGYLIELQCISQSNPFPLQGNTWWVKDATTMTTSAGRFEVHSVEGAFGRLTYELIIHGVEEEDYGVFECRIKNTEGTTSKLIRLEKTDIPQKSIKRGVVISAAGPVPAYGRLLAGLLLLGLVLSR